MTGLLVMRERTAWWTALRTQDGTSRDTDDGSSSSCLLAVHEEFDASSDRGGMRPPGLEGLRGQ
ncbi:hypothetical protein E4U41_003013 [Claviceps citrina]|nr:hypothetical protein E4U41_003013 [Claviceps citrina]